MNDVTSPERFDVAIVGAGIVGLSHAWHAVSAGLRVVVLERDEFAVGASVRNFGHICTTAQSGIVYDYALRARAEWIALGEAAGFPVARAGTLVVARTAAELAVIEEFAVSRNGEDPEAVAVLTAEQLGDRLGLLPPGAVGGAHLAHDLRVNSPDAVPALAAHLASLGVDFRWRENVLLVESGRLVTSRGEFLADRVVVSVGHDVDRFFPELAAAAGVRRCRLRMLEVDAPHDLSVAPGVFTGTSLLRYDGFARTAAAAQLRAELDAQHPELSSHGVNLMFTQRPGSDGDLGRLVIGDTHHYSVTETPFEDEESDEVLLAHFRRLLDVDELRVRRRWRGVYASSEAAPFLVEEPLPGVTAVSVTSGIGMTTALGLAASAF